MVRSRFQSTEMGGWVPAACAASVLCGSILCTYAPRGPADPRAAGFRILVVTEEGETPPSDPPVEADPEVEMLRLWLEILRRLLERSITDERETATALIQKVISIYNIEGLPEDLSEDAIWWTWFLDVGEVLLAAASDHLDVEKVDSMQSMIDDIRVKLVDQQ